MIKTIINHYTIDYELKKQQELGDTKGEIIIHLTKKDRQHSDQNKRT